MTITLQAVNELIASLESAGELSIREQKFLKLAKEFRICSASLDAAIKTGNMLADQNAQLAAENVALKKSAPAPFSKLMMEALDTYHSKADDVPELAMLSAYVKLRDGLKTPATDRIVAGIKADGVEEWVSSRGGRWNGTTGGTAAPAPRWNCSPRAAPCWRQRWKSSSLPTSPPSVLTCAHGGRTKGNLTCARAIRLILPRGRKVKTPPTPLPGTKTPALWRMSVPAASGY